MQSWRRLAGRFVSAVPVVGRVLEAVMDQGEVEIVVQTGNLTEPPKHGATAHRATWKITQEWKIRVPLSLTAEGYAPSECVGPVAAARVALHHSSCAQKRV